MFRNYSVFSALVFFASIIILSCSNESRQGGEVNNFSGQVITWKVGSTHPTNSSVYMALEDLAKKVAELSNGRLVLKTYPAGAIVPATETYPSLVNGVFDAALFFGTWIEGRNSAWSLANHTPMGFEDRDAIQMWYYTDDGIKVINELSAKDNVKVEPFVAQGMEMGMFCRKPVRSLADLKGKKLRIGPGPHVAVFREFGVETLALAYQETYSGLDRGVIDCAEWDVPFSNYEMKLHEVGPYLLYPAWWQPSAISLVGTSQKSYDKLPKDLKAIWDTTVREIGLEWSLKSKELDIEKMELMSKELKEINAFSPEEMKQIRAAVKNVLAEYASKNPDYKKILESQQSFREKYNKFPALFRFPKE